MFFDNSLHISDTSNQFINLENAEVMRLRKLMHDNILKIEKENLEAVKKDLSSQKQNDIISIDETKNVKKTSKFPSTLSSAKTKSTPLRGSKHQSSKPTEVKTSNAQSQLPSGSSDHACRSSESVCEFSSIHFLNHFYSSFISSKAQTSHQPCDIKDNYTPCAVPLAPPSQVKESIDIESNIVSSKNPSFVSNNHNVAYHIMSEDVPKRLTIQKLPSISIVGKTPICNGNVRIEEIKERNYFEGEGIKTTILPALSEEVRNRISRNNLSLPQQSLVSPSRNQDFVVPTCDPKKSVSTQCSAQDQATQSFEMQNNKELLKEMIEEALKDFHLKPQELTVKLPANKNSHLTFEEQEKNPPHNDCELDSFIEIPLDLKDVCMHTAISPYNIYKHYKVSDATSVIPPSILKSSHSQTIDELHHVPFSERNVKHLIQEVITELQQNNSSFCKEQHISREIQASIGSDRVNQDVLNAVSTAVQVTLIKENSFENCDVPNLNETSDLNNVTKEEDIREIISDTAITKGCNHTPQYLREVRAVSETRETSEQPSKLESVLNFMYDRFCRETGELAFNTDRVTLSNTVPSVLTREVSVQINPISTSTKSTATSEVTRIDAVSQYDEILPLKIVEKDIKHASVQVIPEVETVAPPPQKVDSSAQWEQPISTLRDCSIQTLEIPAISENSANTSVSSTPVSDSIFLDDMLSEGEVFLPWNLRLLSHTDKTTFQSSSNTAETTSDKEKDYSLSEGEIPPKYLRQMQMAQSPSYDSSSEAYTDPPRYSQSYKSPGEINPGMQSLQPHLHCKCCHASSSSLSEGEVRASSTSLSEGEVPQAFLRRATLQDFSQVSNITQYESGFFQRNATVNSSDLDNFKVESSLDSSLQSRNPNLDLSEGEVVGITQAPYQSTPCTSFLDAMTEEK
ncbi:uncharacterized protein CEXT_18561 [Caerostris extrusa]|uniref:Uncharacterized protein n=1 Tax=Caerostris extrusa TaxID=172846 RepID=A0AAV4RDX6_CAEEX|nr:uncharacterized protein CEXT_18561 [Caerostris extrusa]